MPQKASPEEKKEKEIKEDSKDDKKPKKEDKKEETFEILENMARVLPQQAPFVAMKEGSRFHPVRKVIPAHGSQLDD